MIRILDFPTTVGLNDELKRLRDSEYVVSTKAADTALLLLRKEMFFEPIHAIPHRYVESVRMLIYKTNLCKHLVNANIPLKKSKRKTKLSQVFHVEMKYLLLIFRNLLQSLPAPDAPSHELDGWQNLTFFQWLHISYYIKPFQCEERDWREFVATRRTFDKPAHQLDWRDWALYEEINCLYYSEYDMVASSYHELKGVDLEAYLYYVLLDFKYIQTKHIPENLRVKAIVWPKEEKSYKYLHRIENPWKGSTIEFNVADPSAPSGYRICEEAFGFGDMDEDRIESEEVREVAMVGVTQNAKPVEDSSDEDSSEESGDEAMGAPAAEMESTAMMGAPAAEMESTATIAAAAAAGETSKGAAAKRTAGRLSDPGTSKKLRAGRAPAEEPSHRNSAIEHYRSTIGKNLN